MRARAPSTIRPWRRSATRWRWRSPIRRTIVAAGYGARELPEPAFWIGAGRVSPGAAEHARGPAHRLPGAQPCRGRRISCRRRWPRGGTRQWAPGTATTLPCQLLCGLRPRSRRASAWRRSVIGRSSAPLTGVDTSEVSGDRQADGPSADRARRSRVVAVTAPARLHLGFLDLRGRARTALRQPRA